MQKLLVANCSRFVPEPSADGEGVQIVPQLFRIGGTNGILANLTSSFAFRRFAGQSRKAGENESIHYE
ncbi:MAG: hypothetical protein UY56_C0018G0004 [Parcubacteria group bacterium GW2011_GWA1_50_14]|nr:MAG: hypothetical protein UY56_C0018G0004 [Parcubacteria group bacterium GW2011_GWA1_50_14]